MSQLSRVFFAATAVALLCGVGGAVQFAAGRDLSGYARSSPANFEASINRSAKTDRAAGVAGVPVQTRTISLPLYGLSDMSVLVRIPVAREARNGAFAPLVTKSGDRKTGSGDRKTGDRKLAVACEPVVSVLTEIAKQLQPGRCVT
jgi:hypothetical protein